MKKKLSLESLKIKSFLTSIETESCQTIIGGEDSNNPGCASVNGADCGNGAKTGRICTSDPA